MAEDTGEKTEAPTPRHREEAREEGNVARSTDLTAAVLLLGFMMMLNSYGGGLVAALRALMARLLGPEAMPSGVQDVGRFIVQSITPVAWAMLPLAAGTIVLAIAANLAQVGFILNPKRLQPNFGLLNPMRGAARMFQGQGVMQLVMSILKLVLVAFVAWSAVQGRLGEIVASQRLEFIQIFGLGASIVYSIAIRVGLLLLFLSLIDYGYQKYHFEQQLKMTKQDVKEEMRRMDGDPRIKQQRRQIAMQMAQHRLKHEVPTADVIVTNPTHFAIALKYDEGTMHAPRVVAKGRDLMAKRIREIARECGIPIVERPPLARALYKMVDVGQEIPEQFYSTVAEILAYVYELTGKLRRRAG
jgi:flagellar biosynthesis protein FlhB